MTRNHTKERRKTCLFICFYSLFSTIHCGSRRIISTFARFCYCCSVFAEWNEGNLLFTQASLALFFSLLFLPFLSSMCDRTASKARLISSRFEIERHFFHRSLCRHDRCTTVPRRISILQLGCQDLWHTRIFHSCSLSKFWNHKMWRKKSFSLSISRNIFISQILCLYVDSDRS